MLLWLHVRRVSDSFFFFNDTATTEIYTLSLHDALPISEARPAAPAGVDGVHRAAAVARRARGAGGGVAGDRRGLGEGRVRSEEHTSELQSRSDLVCRLLLEKKKDERRYDEPDWMSEERI